MSKSAAHRLLPVVSAALDQTRSAACITTAELTFPGPRIVYVNPAYCSMTGRTEAEVLGDSPRIMQGPLTSRAVLDRLRQDLDAGRPFEGEAVNYRKDGTPFLISWRIDPVIDESGLTTHYIATQEDITQQRRAERLLAAELSIDRCVSTLLRKAGDSQVNLDRLVTDIRLAVSDLVEYGEVTIVGSLRVGTDSIGFQAGPDVGGTVELEKLDELEGASTVGRTDGGRHWVGCSLSCRQRGIEGMLVVSELTVAELDYVDRRGLERATESGRRAIDCVAAFERQRFVAIELQRGLLPAAEPTAAGLSVAVRYQPGAFATRVGGDWYDVYEDDRRVVIVVGDMAGSGVQAAADMGRVSLMARVLLQQGLRVPDVFAALNRFCTDEDLMATALAVTIDKETGSAVVATAGHLPPVVRRSTTAEVLAICPGPVLGVGGHPRYPERAIALEPEDVVLMFTDGLVERPEELIDESLRRLAARLLVAGDDIDQIASGVVAGRLEEDPSDDIAVVAFRRLV